MEIVPSHLKPALVNPRSYVKYVFDRGELRNSAREALERFNLSVGSKSYLCEVGLPEGEEILEDSFRLGSSLLGKHLLTLSALAEELSLPTPSHCRGALCLYLSKYGGVIVVDGARDDGVYSIGLERDYNATLINSCAEKFGVFLALYVAHCRTTAPLPFEQRGEVDLKLERCMYAIDPGAFGDPENWWSTVLEEMMSGLR